MVGLVLEAVDIADDKRHWRWRLTDGGTAVAEHVVAIDPATPEAEAFTDLYRYLRWNADPGQRVESEAAIVDHIGAWIGERVLGGSVCEAIVRAAPVTVRVRAPDFLLSAPLELAHVNGKALARRGDVTLVYDIGDGTPAKPETRDHLRMVAVFSLPTETTALALRRERYELTRLVRRLAARSRRMVRLEVLQYGVTREVLRERMTESGGPDVLHLSGHGATEVVLLETDDGRSDPVPMDELLELLRPAKGRLRLAVLSACQSAAVATADTLRWLDLEEAAEQAQQTADAEEARSVVKPAMAQRVAQQLGCAVAAMRYPVVDDFAVRLSGALYEGLFTLDLPLDRALARAVSEAAGPAPSPGSPAVSVATPTLFGAAAIGMSLTPPKGPPAFDPAVHAMAEFPDEPPRFVGRAGAMARAIRALGAGSGQSGVLFHGMAGAGKTSCALELAYRQQDRFAKPVWWQAPLHEDEWPRALTNLAIALENQLGEFGFAIVDKIGTVQALRQFQPKLRSMLRNNGLLIVLDNLETLLTDAGEWRDPRWAELVETLTTHGGESRIVFTSRVRPAGLAASVRIEPVHALSRDESVLLAREMPNLRRLLHADSGTTSLGMDSDRATVRRILRVVQGHPKLMELADAAAADPARLADQLAAAETAVSDKVLAAFFAHGESTLDNAGFVRTLSSWTLTAMTALPPDARLLLQVLAGMEDSDRSAEVLENNWADLCRRLQIDPSSLSGALAPLTAAALVERDDVRLRLHPGIVEAVRAGTPESVREATDLQLGDYWTDVAQEALLRDGGEHTPTIVRASLAAAPYVISRQRWSDATALIAQTLLRDRTVAVSQLAAAHVQRVADATGSLEDLALLGTATGLIDSAAAERLLQTALQRATDEGNHEVAAAAANDLINLYQESGRLRDALALADRMSEHAGLADLGPWIPMLFESSRLHTLNLLAQNEYVLTEVHKMLQRMQTLPNPFDDNDLTLVWRVRETVLHVGTRAALILERWQEALELNAATVASMRARGAGSHTMAVARFYDYGPLLRLGRLDQADQLLRDCQRVFEACQDIPMLAMTFAARADHADEQGHYRDAVGLQQTALRLLYTRPSLHDLASCHRNLAIYLNRAGADPAGRLAHLLAAGVIVQLIGQAERMAELLPSLAWEVRELPGVSTPATITELAEAVERAEGVRFGALVVALAGDSDTAQQALDAVRDKSRALPHELQQWEPCLYTLVSVVDGDADAAAALEQELASIADSEDWSSLVVALRRIVAGQRDAEQLTAGLDWLDRAIVTLALDALAGRVTLNAPAAGVGEPTSTRGES